MTGAIVAVLAILCKGSRRAAFGIALLAAAVGGPATSPAQNVTAEAASAAVPPAPEPEGPIAALQQQLRREGYAPGPINGVMTKQTRRAIAAYRRRTGRLPDSLAASADWDPVRQVQSGLRQLGFFAGASDGVVGPDTRDAIVRFSAARHLAIDPRVSDRLLAEIAAAGGNPAPTASPEAPRSRPAPGWVDPSPMR